MEIFFLMAILGIIARVIAGSKGRSKIGWALGTFFFGFPILILLFLPKLQDRIDEQLAKKGKMKKCVECAEYVKTDASICKHCGAKFSPENTWPSDRASSPKSKKAKSNDLEDAEDLLDDFLDE